MIRKTRNSNFATLAWPITREPKLYEQQGRKHSLTLKTSLHQGHSCQRKSRPKNLRNTSTWIEIKQNTKGFIFQANQALKVQKKGNFTARKAEAMIQAKLELRLLTSNRASCRYLTYHPWTELTLTIHKDTNTMILRKSFPS